MLVDNGVSFQSEQRSVRSSAQGMSSSHSCVAGTVLLCFAHSSQQPCKPGLGKGSAQLRELDTAEVMSTAVARITC